MTAAAQRYELPEVMDVRRRIEGVREEPIRYCLMAMFLFGCRVSELVGCASGSDTTTPYGPRGTDVFEDTYRFPPASPVIVEPCAVFKIRTAKKKGMLRYVGLPLNPVYEPWTRPLLEYYRKRGDGHVFPFTRQTVRNYSSKVFEGFTYVIDDYYLFQEGGAAKVEEHQRDAANHFLRHLRASQLMSYYGFTKDQAAPFGGWKIQGLTESMRRYIYLNWQAYFPNLLRPL